MKFENPVYEGKIIKRYKRFLADVDLDGELITAHTANTGSMRTCWEKDWPVLLSFHDNPKRKLKYSLEMTHNGKTWIGVNTSRPNHLVKEAIEKGIIKEVQNYDTIKPEKKIGDSRIDLYLEGRRKKKNCYIEVKNVTLLEDENIGAFPDAVSTRGQKHLKELIKIVESGHRAIIFFVVQREDVKIFKPAKDVDPEYARLLKVAKQKGVEILVYGCRLNKKEIKISHSLPYKLV